MASCLYHIGEIAIHPKKKKKTLHKILARGLDMTSRNGAKGKPQPAHRPITSLNTRKKQNKAESFFSMSNLPPT